MSFKVVIYQVREHKRSRIVCEAMLHGIARHGVDVVSKWEDEFVDVEADVAFFYGLEGRLGRVFREYSEKAKAAYVDLGYWGRKHDGRWSGYHKIALNARHPTEYFQNKSHDGRRAAAFDIHIEPWRTTGNHIVLAGMGDKGAKAEGFKPEEWERWAINELRKHTKRPIIYRPKPSWKNSKPLAGAGFSRERASQDRDKGLQTALNGCYAVVTHHSNVAIDGILQGIPAFVWKGVAVGMGLQDLSRINDPLRPTKEQRAQWVNDITYCQWSIKEMHDGIAWADLRREGLL